MRLSDYIDPYVGSVGHLLTATQPICALPHGMSQVQPKFTQGTKDYYLADSIIGISAGSFLFMPENEKGEFSSRFDHDLETVKAYGGKIWLENSECTAEYTATAHGGLVKFTFDRPGTHRVLIRSGSAVLIDGKYVTGVGGYLRGKDFAVCVPSREFTHTETSGAFTTRRGEHKWNGIVITFEGEDIEFPFATSFVGRPSAIRSLETEVEGKTLEDLKEACAAAWDKLLGHFTVEGDEYRKKIFYTALYRVFHRQICISENGEYYSGFDKSVHADDGHKFYCDDGVWDTHRGAHPLQALIEPEVHADILESFIRQYDQSGWLHDFPYPHGGVPCMLGTHTTTLFANALAHGIPFDADRAWKAVRFAHFEGSLLPWHIGPETSYDRCYREKGFAPAIHPDAEETIPEVHPFERRQAVAVTLEQAYDDYCAAKLADKVGADEDAATLRKWSQNYRNLFDSSIGFMAPRDENGEFIKPYDPKMAYAQGGRDYFAECNGWIYTMEVRHDVAGLMELLGGKEKFAERMDAIFSEQPDIPVYHWLSRFPDSTGLIGQFCMGNEPAFHIPYMYNFCGQPWKTQKILHDICRVYFSAHPLGICGDEDGGAMSAWYAFTAMGFYPFCVGSGTYVIGSPMFDKISMELGNGNTFTVIASGVTEGKKYISGAKLNGCELDRSWFTADELLAGGTLELTMSAKPDKTWATGEGAVPPSLY